MNQDKAIESIKEQPNFIQVGPQQKKEKENKEKEITKDQNDIGNKNKSNEENVSTPKRIKIRITLTPDKNKNRSDKKENINTLKIKKRKIKFSSTSDPHNLKRCTLTSDKNKNRSDEKENINKIKKRKIKFSSTSDPHNLKRFTRTHAKYYHQAYSEIQAGKKRSCWSWYIFPTPPWIVNGQERGSFMNRKYCLRTDAQAVAFLTFRADGQDLRQNYFEILKATKAQIEKGITACRLLGIVDEPKFKSSVKLFERITRNGVDDELHTLCEELLRLVGE